MVSSSETDVTSKPGDIGQEFDKLSIRLQQNGNSLDSTEGLELVFSRLITDFAGCPVNSNRSAPAHVFIAQPFKLPQAA